MSSITLHSLDAELNLRLTEEARKNKKSKNNYIKGLLSHSLGISAAGCHADDYREFCGMWTVEERAAFDSFQADNSQVDAGDWQT